MIGQIVKNVDSKHEAIQSALSYGAGGSLALLAAMVDIAVTAQAVGLVLGCLVILVRLIHDCVGLYRYIMNKDKRKDDK